MCILVVKSPESEVLEPEDWPRSCHRPHDWSSCHAWLPLCHSFHDGHLSLSCFQERVWNMVPGYALRFDQTSSGAFSQSFTSNDALNTECVHCCFRFSTSFASANSGGGLFFSSFHSFCCKELNGMENKSGPSSVWQVIVVTPTSLISTTKPKGKECRMASTSLDRRTW